jgi:hypothetical protein
MTAEVTREEILNKYMVQSSGIATTGWTKHTLDYILAELMASILVDFIGILMMATQ